MRIIVDYRPALRARTGAGVYVHELVRAFTARHRHDVVVFSSSWRDRVAPGVSTTLNARVVDQYAPVRLLNFLWHRWQTPSIEALAGRADVVHAAHPLLIPTTRAAQVVTIHDLYFLDHPHATQGEIRRDYPTLARAHARRADAIVTSSASTKRLVVERLGVDAAHVHVVAPGIPPLSVTRPLEAPADGHVLFLGTVEHRKNLDVVLDAYERLAAQGRRAPRLIVAGGEGPGGRPTLRRLTSPSLRAMSEYRGYVDDPARNELLAGARLLVLPSWDEGFGLPALEAMAAGVPVVVSNRGALPEVVGDAGIVLPPTDAGAWADAIERLAHDDALASRLGEAGRARARAFSWGEAADNLLAAYLSAVARRAGRT